MTGADRQAHELVQAHGSHAPTIVAQALGAAIAASDWDTVATVSAIRREVRRLLRG